MFRIAFVCVIALAGCSASLISPTTGGTTVSNYLVKSASVTLSGGSLAGQSKAALVSNSGYPLYYNASDPLNSTSVTGDCAKKWFPLLATPSAASGDPSLTGTIKVANTQNGSQVEYNGRFLFYLPTSANNVNGDIPKSSTAVGDGFTDACGAWSLATP